MPGAKKMIVGASVAAAGLGVGFAVSEVVAVDSNGKIEAAGSASSGTVRSGRKKNRGGGMSKKKQASGSGSSQAAQVMAVNADGAVEDMKSMQQSPDANLDMTPTADADEKTFKTIDHKGDATLSFSEMQAHENEKDLVADTKAKDSDEPHHHNDPKLLEPEGSEQEATDTETGEHELLEPEVDEQASLIDRAADRGETRATEMDTAAVVKGKAKTKSYTPRRRTRRRCTFADCNPYGKTCGSDGECFATIVPR